jgi:import inner membrane translocase subunit TIM44
MDQFMTDARRFIVPELMEAYLKGDVETLKLWCSEAVSRVEWFFRKRGKKYG